jgi:primosomal protein N' (replication factor Y)
MTLYADVVFPLPLNQSFSYIVPAARQEEVHPGSRVVAPLGSRTLMGFIVRIHTVAPSAGVSLKEIRDVVRSAPVIPAEILSLTQKLSDYYLSSWGEFLDASLPLPLTQKTSVKVVLSEKGHAARQEATLSREEKKIADILQDKMYSLVFLKRRSGVRNFSSLAARMQKKGLIYAAEETKMIRPRKASVSPSPPAQLELDFFLDPAVQDAVEKISAAMDKGDFAAFYLFGGQSRREAVYFHLSRKALASSRKVLFLVPEISLSGSIEEKLRKRLGEKAVLVHSRMSAEARESETRKAAEPAAELMVGTRSALFVTLRNTGLLIVDEEHDDAYYQPESPSYDARRGARIRAEIEKCVLLSGSDRPTVESYYRAQNAGCLISVGGLEDDHKVLIIDDSRERGLVSKELRARIEANMRSGKRSLVFLNRRGYASFLFCPRCGHIPKCGRCDISLAFHKKDNALVCHYCNFAGPRPQACPRCGGRILEPRGAGLEAVEEELRRLVPQARIAGFDSDRVKTRAAREKILEKFRRGKIDVLLGTQLLGHEIGLPPVSLVGVLNPEALLAFSDFRAAQKTYQALRGMMRFAGAPDAAAEIVIQTAFPDHYSIREAARGDYPAFFNQEIGFRRLMNYPPFSAMAEVVLRGQDFRTLGQKARELAGRIKNLSRDVEILGPAKAPVAQLRGEKRLQVILKAESDEKLTEILHESLKDIRIKKSVVRYG